jgi:hypothetical protein
MEETRAPTVAVSTRLERIAKLAKDKPGVALTTLAHHIDLEWLRAAYRRMEGLVLSHPEAGTPQGGVVSPLLANVYLHEVLDEWFVRQVQPRACGPGAARALVCLTWAGGSVCTT